MIKYSIMRYTQPNIKTATAQIEVMCCPVNHPDLTYWKPSNSSRNAWKLFNEFNEASDYSKNIENAFVFGVQL